MTPKEKAKELFDKFEEYGWESPTNSRITRWNVIQMILSVIVEIIKALEDSKNHIEMDSRYDIDVYMIQYWNDIKEEVKILENTGA